MCAQGVPGRCKAGGQRLREQKVLRALAAEVFLDDPCQG